MSKEEDFKEMVKKNIWEDNFDEVVEFIKLASKKPEYTEKGQAIPGKLYWSWARNTVCKYVTLRIDMRDGGFVIQDRDGKRISLDDLKYQYKSGDE